MVAQAKMLPQVILIALAGRSLDLPSERKPIGSDANLGTDADLLTVFARSSRTSSQ